MPHRTGLCRAPSLRRSDGDPDRFRSRTARIALGRRRLRHSPCDSTTAPGCCRGCARSGPHTVSVRIAAALRGGAEARAGWGLPRYFEHGDRRRRRPRRTASTGGEVAGGRNTGEVFDKGAAAVDTPSRPRHPLPWRNTPSDGDNHLRDADGRSVYDGPDAAEMFRLYDAAAQADRASRVHADHPGPQGRRGAGLVDLVNRVRGLLHRE